MLEAADAELERLLDRGSPAGRRARPRPSAPPRTVRARPPAAHEPRWHWSRCRARTRSPRRMDAVEAGLSVMIFSDNVPVEQEVLLKERAGGAACWSWAPTAAPP